MFVVLINLVNAQSLHHKNDWTTRNLNYELEFSILSYSYTGCIFFSLLPNPYFHTNVFYQNPIKYCNTLKHNTQYANDPYCFTPSILVKLGHSIG